VANFSVFCNHVLTPPAMEHVLAAPGIALDGFLGPSHVSTVIGAGPIARWWRNMGGRW
jgi:hydrogenase expression/formation protein HypD